MVDILSLERYTVLCKGVTCNPTIISGISKNHNRSSPENKGKAHRPNQDNEKSTIVKVTKCH